MNKMSEDSFKLPPLLEEISNDVGDNLFDDDDEISDTHIIDKETSQIKKGFQLSLSQSAASTLSGVFSWCFKKLCLKF